ncbi:site-2 protease family protein, partial [Chloroflexota bacterium]
MQTFETDNLTSIVGRVLRIDDITIGGTDQDFLARYRGQLYDSDSGRSYDQLASNLRSLNITPLFRTEEDQHVVLLVQGRIEPRPSNPLINLVLFIFTVLSVIFAGALYSFSGPFPSDQSELLAAIMQGLASGIPFAVSLLAILLAHEFGHYIAGRYHHTHVTLPYFIPFPLSPFGTMGAFIQLKEPPKNKRILLDIGVSGPIAGLVVAFPILLFGLSLSHIETIILPAGQGIQLEGNSLLYLLAKYIVFGQLLPAPSTYGDLPAFLYWVRYFFTSQPLPLGVVGSRWAPRSSKPVTG